MPGKPADRWIANVRLTIDTPGGGHAVVKPGGEVKDPPEWLKKQNLISPAGPDKNEESD